MSGLLPANTAPFTLDEIVSATQGEVRQAAAGAVSVQGISTDTRADLSNKAFVALVGENFDAHAFLDAAIESGASLLIVAKTPPQPVPDSVTVVRVEDTLLALGALARFHRRRWGRSVVGVAGSVGKTTTRSAIASLLEAVHPGGVHATIANLNNRIGVPLMLLGLEPRHQVAVIELGTNQPGEVATLTAIAEPDVAVLTRIVLEHTEYLGDLDAIEAEEGAIFERLAKDGVAVANADDPRTAGLLQACAAGMKLSYGVSAHATYRLRSREPRGLGSTRLSLERPVGLAQRAREHMSIDAALVGEPGALALAAAVAVADAIAAAPIAGEALQGALAQHPPGEPGRLFPIALADGGVVVDDTYNASPASVLAALRAARELADERNARLIAVIGEMRELGPISRKEHEDIGKALGEFQLASLIAVSGDAARIAEAADQQEIENVFVDNSTQALAATSERMRPGDVVLIKGSRGVALESVVQGLILQYGAGSERE
jgi:UDP-N-acetylmuramoyl-tripeptide--D-alanyl-D-alanine ligase